MKSTEDIQEPFKTLKNIEWYATEKIDGTNTRIYRDGYNVEIYGRTEKSVWDKEVLTDLEAMFKTEQFENLMEQNFDSKEVILFGETYGEKIQDGHTYSDKREFRLFDVKVNGHDLDYQNVRLVAGELGIEYVPEMCMFENLANVFEYLKQKKTSMINKNREVEGLVIRPLIQLYDKNKEPIRAKIRWEDINKIGYEKMRIQVKEILEVDD